MKENEILDSNYFENDNSGRIPVELISINKFILLFLFSLGLYGAWWQYKVWRLFKEKNGMDIMPGMRAIFAIIFLYPLLGDILKFAHQEGYQKSYAPGALYIGFIVTNAFGRLPDPFWIISLFAFMFLVPGVSALNFALKNSDLYNTTEPDGFNNRQLVVLLVGGLLWVLMFLGMFATEDNYSY